MSGVGPVAIDQGLSVAISVNSPLVHEAGSVSNNHKVYIGLRESVHRAGPAHGESMAQNVQRAHRACLTSQMDEKRP
jgi:hypothetical protein